MVLLEFQNKTNIDTHLDLLNTDITCKYFVCLHNIFKVKFVIESDTHKEDLANLLKFSG